MRRFVLFSCLCLSPLACSRNDAPAPKGPPFSPTHVGPSRTQAGALGRLEADTGSDWRVGFDPRWNTPTLTSGKTPPLVGNGTQPADAARDFLGRYRDLFGIDDPATQLTLVGSTTAANGWIRVDFDQLAGTLRVHAAGLRVHFDAQGSLRVVSGRFIPLLDPKLEQAAVLDQTSAIALATDDLLGAVRTAVPSDIGAAASELVVFADGRRPRPAWLVRLTIAHARLVGADYAIDAGTGSVIGRADATRTFAGSGVGVHGNRRPLEVSEVLLEDGSLVYRLVDEGRGISTRTAGGADWSADGMFGLVESVTADTWDVGTKAAGAAVDAHANLGSAWDYFAGRLGRASFDGAGTPITAVVHLATRLDDFAGSAWDGGDQTFLFADDSGGAFAGAGALDVVAHEFTHAVIDTTAALDGIDQPGALGEAIADIFACFVEHATGADDRKSTVVGEDVTGSGAPIRDLAHPQKTGQPDHMAGLGAPKGVPGIAPLPGGADPHRDAGIVANAWYLMTFGGRNDTSGAVVTDPIGWDASEQIWYRALTEYLHPASGFETAALATVQAAGDLYGQDSAQARTVSCAWAATGVLPNGCNPLPPPDGSICRFAAAPNHDLGQASDVTFCRDLCGVLSPDNRDDYWAIHGTAGQFVDIRLDALSGDYDLYLLDDSGNVLSVSASPGTTPEALTGIFDRDGTYYVQVAGGTFFSAQPYRLTVGSQPVCNLVHATGGINIDIMNAAATPMPAQIAELGTTRLRMVLQVDHPGCTGDDTASQSDLAPAFMLYDDAIAKYGVDVLLVLNNQSACIPDGMRPPDLAGNAAAFDRYLRNFRQRASDIAQHYEHNGHILGFEIWNEEDDDGCAADYCPFLPAPSYARLLTAATAAVHAFGGKVIMGGLETGQPKYPEDVRTAMGDGWKNVDAVAVHPYTKWPTADGDASTSIPLYLQSVADDLGKPIMVTEWGTPDNSAQRSYIHDYFLWFAQNPGYAGVTDSFYFAWSDTQKPGQPFGLFDAAGQKKPDSWQSFHDAATRGP